MASALLRSSALRGSAFRAAAAAPGIAAAAGEGLARQVVSLPSSPLRFINSGAPGPKSPDDKRVIITKIDNILAKSSSLSEKSAELYELMNQEAKAAEALKKTFEATEVAEFLKQLSGKVDGKTEEVMGLLERNCQEIKSLKDQGTETIAILKKILSIVEQNQTSSAEAALQVVEPGPEKKPFLSVKRFARVVKILLAKLEEDPEYKETVLYLSYIHQTLDDDDYERFVHSGKRVVTVTAGSAKSKLHNLKLKMRLKIILVAFLEMIKSVVKSKPFKTVLWLALCLFLSWVQKYIFKFIFG